MHDWADINEGSTYLMAHDNAVSNIDYYSFSLSYIEAQVKL